MSAPLFMLSLNLVELKNGCTTNGCLLSGLFTHDFTLDVLAIR